MITVSLKIKDFNTISDPKIPGAIRITGFINVMDIPPRIKPGEHDDELTKLLSEYPIPPFPNPRLPEIPLSAKDKIIRDSLENINVEMCEINNFHTKNNGVKLVIYSCEINNYKTSLLTPEEISKHYAVYDVTFRPKTDDYIGDGCLDGLHTLGVIWHSQPNILKKNSNPDNSKINQMVKIEMLQGFPVELIIPMARGLNTNSQVDVPSLCNLGNGYEWIKSLFVEKPYANDIKYHQGDHNEGKKCKISVTDIISVGLCLNRKMFPSPEKTLNSYNVQTINVEYDKNRKKWITGEVYDSYPPDFSRYIIEDGMTLKDIIQYDIAEIIIKKEEEKSLSNKTNKKAQLLSLCPRKKGNVHFPFIGKKSHYVLPELATYYVLSGFRFLTEPKNEYLHWQYDFDFVLSVFESAKEEIAIELLEYNEQIGGVQTWTHYPSIWRGMASLVEKHTALVKLKMMQSVA